ncbi:hypothetical protein ACE103_31910 [Bradyrhizobium sp. ma5]|uniref:hypothetical protein n=1 Tax=Bradyrhizobium sp. ma5 TaxID=3344828 RepID=UPI0035D3F887
MTHPEHRHGNHVLEIVEDGDRRGIGCDEDGGGIEAKQEIKGSPHRVEQLLPAFAAVGKARAICEIDEVLARKRALQGGHRCIAANAGVEHGNRLGQGRKVEHLIGHWL